MLARCITIFMLLGLLLGAIAAPIMDSNEVAVEARGSSSTDGVVGTDFNEKRQGSGPSTDWKRQGSGPSTDWKRQGSGTSTDWKRQGSGTSTDWKRQGSGTSTDWKRQGSGHSTDWAKVEGQAL